MSRFICLCGATFKRQHDASSHVEFHHGLALLEGCPRHKIFKQHWQARFAKWCSNLNWGRVMHFVGGYIIYLVGIHHFHIELNLWEAGFMGLGMGLYLG